MEKPKAIFITIIALIAIFLLASIFSPVLVVAEDSEEDSSIDMAAKFSILGIDWVYPGSSVNEYGQTLHNVHINYPQDPYGAARDIMSYSYGQTPHLIVSVNNDAAQAIFGASIVDNIRANDGYYGYAGNGNVAGTMSRGGAMETAMLQNGMNLFEVPLQILLGNISFHIV